MKRIRRQEDTTKKEESFETELCKDKDAGEWFRLVAGEGDNCRDVIQCTSSVCSHCSHISQRAILIAAFYSVCRACKPSVAPPVCTSTSRSRPATGRAQSKTASSRARRGRSSLCSTPTSPFARTVSSLAEMVLALSAVFSVTERRTVTTVPTRTVAVS